MHARGGKLRETPLHIASRVKDGDQCALMLLKSGASPNLATDDGQTPVHSASKTGNLQTLILLLEDGGDAMYASNVSITFLLLLSKLFFFSLCSIQKLSNKSILIYFQSINFRKEKLHCIWHVEHVNRKSYNN